MRRFQGMCALLTLRLLLAVAPVQAQTAICPGAGKGMDPVGFETLTVSTVAIGFTAATITSTTAGAAFVTVEAQPLRFTLSGTPTSTSGHLIEPPPTGNADGTRGGWICGRAALLAWRAIRSGSSDSTVRVTYYRIR